MIRAIILTAALAIGLTAAVPAQASNFRINIGIGHGVGGLHHRHFHPPGLYKVCYYKSCWGGYRKHKVFHSYCDAKEFVCHIERFGYYTHISRLYGGY